MSDVTLGVLPSGPVERDAIHVAVVPMIASEMLRPGQRIGVVGDGIAGPSGKITGIVDPYLTDVVPKGSAFWMCLLPGTVTGMRHHWIHPDFSGPAMPGVTESVAYLMRQADDRGLKYEEFMGFVAEFVETGRHIIQGGRFEGEGIYEDEFWPHYENATGTKVKEDDRGSVFSCSC